jgi:hypothetical protein
MSAFGGKADIDLVRKSVVRCDARVSFLLFQTVSFDTSAGSCLNSNPYEGKFGTFLRIPLGMIACTFSDPGLGQEQTMKAL